MRYTHSCVRLEFDGAVIVIDPGIWSEPEALIGADAVLVTHEHSDHVDEDRLADLRVPIFAPEGAALPRLDYRPVESAGPLSVAGIEVDVVAGPHAPVLAEVESGANIGYVVGGVYHPGDALRPPPRAVDTLLVPMQASWLKTAEGVAFLRTAEYRRAFGIHDGQINDRAIASINHWYDIGSGGRYEYLAPGSAYLT